MGYLLIASYLCAHFTFFAVELRHRQAFRRESGIILLHLASAAVLVVAATTWFVVEPNEDRLTFAVTAAAAHGIYSLTFLEIWALSDGGYSLRLLSDVVRRDTETIDQLERDFATVSTSKKGIRLQSLLNLGLLRDNNGTFALTSRGRSSPDLSCLFRNSRKSTCLDSLMWLLHVIIALAVASLAQNVLVRLRLVGNPLLAFLASGAFLGTWLIATLFHGYGASITVAGTLLFAFFSELYIFLFSLAYSSVSANLLQRLLGRSMDRAAIDRLYDDNSMIANRLRGLTQIGLLASANGKVLATRNGKRVAAIFTAVQSFFDHNPGS